MAKVLRSAVAALPSTAPTYVGRVVSAKMQKTVNVLVPRYTYNARYKRMLRSFKKFMAHDPGMKTRRPSRGSASAGTTRVPASSTADGACDCWRVAEELGNLHDVVRIRSCRPISKNKHFELIEVIKAHPRVDNYEMPPAGAEAEEKKGQPAAAEQAGQSAPLS
jgi:ribosomal protein S17